MAKGYWIATGKVNDLKRIKKYFFITFVKFVIIFCEF